jgi:hypothetical protein
LVVHPFLSFFFFFFSLSALPSLLLYVPFAYLSTGIPRLFCIIIIGAERRDLQGAC